MRRRSCRRRTTVRPAMWLVKNLTTKRHQHDLRNVRIPQMCGNSNRAEQPPPSLRRIDLRMRRTCDQRCLDDSPRRLRSSCSGRRERDRRMQCVRRNFCCQMRGNLRHERVPLWIDPRRSRQAREHAERRDGDRTGQPHQQVSTAVALYDFVHKGSQLLSGYRGIFVYGRRWGRRGVKHGRAERCIRDVGLRVL